LRILFALPYGPGQTRVRSRMILERLCAKHDVTLVGLAWSATDAEILGLWRSKASTVHVVPHGRTGQLGGLLGDPFRSFQEMVSTSPRFAHCVRKQIAAAEMAGRPYDVVHIEHFRGAVAANLFQGLDAHVVYDAVDCLAALAQQAQMFGVDRRVRIVAGLERTRTQRAEDRLIDQASFISVVAERDRMAMVRGRAIENVVVIPNGVESAVVRLGPLPDLPRAVFTGKLSYHANQAALKWLLDSIWPQVRRALPTAELTVAGADPPEWVRQATRAAGIILIANPPDMPSVLRTARVAVAPITYSVGIQNKVLEAMGAGLPVVASSSAAAGLGNSIPPGIAVADTAEAFASEIVRLFREDTYAESLRREGFDYVMKNHDWDEVVRAFERLYVPSTVAAKVA
jgi:polysaccharide biosynthesis protein PslH